METVPVRPLQAVVFDLDGTLIDSLPDIAAALNVALDGAGLVQLPEPAVRAMIGNGSEVLVARAIAEATGEAVPPALSGEVHTAFLEAYDAAPCIHSRLYPGARDVLGRLAADGIGLGICTNKPQQITLHILRKLEIEGLFGCVAGGNAAEPLKPSPDMLRRVLRVLGVEPQVSVMVGDSGADARAAKTAGMALILLEHGYCQEDLSSLGADVILPGFDDLPDALVRVTRSSA